MNDKKKIGIDISKYRLRVHVEVVINVLDQK